MTIHKRSDMTRQTFTRAGRWLAGLTLCACAYTGCRGNVTVCEDTVGGVCIGVPNQVCDSDACIERVECRAVVRVQSQDELSEALSAASRGDCIVPAPGVYGDAALPAGVRLLGSSARDVSLRALTLAAGSTVRGVAIIGGGVSVLPGAAGARLEAALVQDSSENGITVGDGASLSLVRSTVTDARVHGLYASPFTTVTIDESVISDGGGPGIWASCKKACCDATDGRPELAVRDTLIRRNRIVGIALYGADASLHNAAVVETQPGGSFDFGYGGGGLSVRGCSSVQASAVRFDENRYYGVLVDGSTAVLGADHRGEGVEINGNLMGMWVRNIGEGRSVRLEHATLEGNEGVGVGVADASRSVLIRHVLVGGTQMRAFPVAGKDKLGMKREVGDGIVWLGGSSVIFDDVVSADNARAGILIDGPVGAGSPQSLLRDVRASGNGAVDVVQQRLPAGGASPTVIDSPFEVSTSEVLEAPDGPPLLGEDL